MLRFASVFAFLFLALLVLQAAHASTTKGEEKNDYDDERKRDRILVERRAEFKSWSEMHEKTYESPDHEAERFQIWMENDEKIKKHNSQVPASSYAMGHNAFSDMTHEEFAAHVGLMTNKVADAESQRRAVENEANDIEEDRHPGLRRKLGISMDWRNVRGVSFVPQVRNAGSCSCSYAIAAIGVIESSFMLKNDVYTKTGNRTQALSVQQIVDCDTSNFGCSGGWHGRAIEYAAKVGLVTEAEYPYTAVSGKCKYQQINKSKLYRLAGVYPISTSQEDLLDAVRNTGPVAVAVDASSYAWMTYKSGILDHVVCNNTVANHAVLAVGYDYGGNWILQNSWGTTWGEKGYIRISGTSCGYRAGGVLFDPYTVAVK